MNEINEVEAMFGVKMDRRCGKRKVETDGIVSYGLKADGTPRGKPGRKAGVKNLVKAQPAIPIVGDGNGIINNVVDELTIKAATQKRIEELKKAGYSGWVHKEVQKDVVKLTGRSYKVVRGTIGERHILKISPHPIKYYLMEEMNEEDHTKLFNSKKIYGMSINYYSGIDVFDDSGIAAEYPSLRLYEENDYRWAGRQETRQKILAQIPIEEEQRFLTFPSRQGCDVKYFAQRHGVKIVCVEKDPEIMNLWKENKQGIETIDHECDILSYVRLRAVDAARYDLINFDGPIYDTEDSTEALSIINEKKMGKVVAISMQHLTKFRNIKMTDDNKLTWAGKMTLKYDGVADRCKQLQIDTMSNYDLVENGEIIWKKNKHTKQWMRTLIFKLKVGI